MRRRLGIVVLLGWVAAGCSGAVSPAAPTTTATAAATAVPSPGVPASLPAVPTPSPTPPSATSAAPTATAAPLPQAEILGAGALIPGELGSYVVDGHGSDGPWLPFDVLPVAHVAMSELMTVRFVDGVAIGDFVAVIATAADRGGTSPESVPARLAGAGSASLIVGPLPAGRWVLSVRLFRADGRGDGTTYWAVTAA